MALTIPNPPKAGGRLDNAKHCLGFSLTPPRIGKKQKFKCVSPHFHKQHGGSMGFEKIVVDEGGDAGEFWISQVLSYRDVDTRFVFCLGGSVSFVSALLQAGYRVIVIDRDISAFLDTKKSLEEEKLGDTRAHLHFLCVDVEQGIGAILHPNDAFLVVRCLHHMGSIATALSLFADYARDGALLAILDTTKELLEQGISDRQYWHEGYKGSEHETHDHLCLQGCVTSGLRNEESVRALLGENGLADISDFHYPIPCPCGRWGCGSVMSYWLGVWNRDEENIVLHQEE